MAEQILQFKMKVAIRSLIRSNHIDPNITPERINYLRQQEVLYKQAKPDLLRQYKGRFIVFENAAVLDYVLDEQALLRRVYQQQGYRDLLIKQVLLKEPHFSVRGAFTGSQEN